MEDSDFGIRAKVGGQFRITPDEAAAHGLPPIGIAFDATELTGVSILRCPGPQYFVQANGPPGGPYRLEVEWVPRSADGRLPTPTELASRDDGLGTDFQLHHVGECALGGTMHPAAVWSFRVIHWSLRCVGMRVSLGSDRGCLWVVLPANTGSALAVDSREQRVADTFVVADVPMDGGR